MGLFTNDKTIRIECKGSTEVDIDELVPLQGNLKTLMDEDYEKLKDSILTLGFSDPYSIWIHDGTKYTHDGHERTLTLMRMRQEGYEIPKLPASEIFAKDKTEAKKKLLANDSRYGKISESGLTDFMNEEDSSFTVEDVAFIEIPEFDFETGEDEDATPGNTGISEPKEVTCPECSAKFVPSK